MLERDKSFLASLTFELRPLPERPPQEVVGRVTWAGLETEL